MSAIDKIYVSDWSDFKAIRDWAKSVGTIYVTVGDQKIGYTPYNWILHPNITEDMFNTQKNKCWAEAKARYAEPDGKEYYRWYIEKYGDDFINDPNIFFEMPVWDTGTDQDIILIRHCPLDIVQNAIKEQYTESFIESAKNYTTEYDTFSRNGVRHPHLKIEWEVNHRIKDRRFWWWIDIIEPANATLRDTHGSAWYDVSSNKWHYEYEMVGDDINCYVSNTCTKYVGSMSMRKVKRIVSKWNLPKGTRIHFEAVLNRYVQKSFVVTIK